MPLLANTDGKTFSQKTVLNLLNNRANWEKVSNYMRAESKKNNFYGWQMDLEYIPVSHKEIFTEFIKYLRSEFNKDGLKLSIAVVSKISNNPKDYEAWYWNNWAGAYDYKVLSEYTDFLSIMAYDQPKGPGPVATIGWSKKVLDYTLTQVPASKISFGIPVYGWAYRSTDLKAGKKQFRMVDYLLTQTKLNNTSTKLADKTTGHGTSNIFGNISWVSYNYGGKNYTIWYEDKNSFIKKYNQLKSANVLGYSVWVLGDEDPAIWSLDSD